MTGLKNRIVILASHAIQESETNAIKVLFCIAIQIFPDLRLPSDFKIGRNVYSTPKTCILRKPGHLN